MADLINFLLTFLPLALPIGLAVFAGRFLASRNFLGAGGVGLAAASLYPIVHWYLLRYAFGVSANPNDEDDVVGSLLIWLMMLIEVPICLLAYLITRSISRNANRSYGDR